MTLLRLIMLAQLSPALVALSVQRAPSGEPRSTAEALIGELGCAGCHAGMPARLGAAPPLGPGGDRHDEAWLAAYLKQGSLPRSGARGRMPDFHLDDAERIALAAFLSSSSRTEAALGRRIFIGLNCTGCHAYSGIAAPMVGACSPRPCSG